jgi:hypothetical protein
LGPKAAGTVGVLVPGDLVVQHGGGEHVGIAVAVEVRGEDGYRAIGNRGDDLLAAKAARAIGVLVPGDLVVHVGGGEHVGIAISVQVGGEDRPSPVGEGGDDLLGAKAAGAVGVLVPGDLVVEL